MGVPAPARTLPDPRPFERHFTTPTGGPYDGITWATRDAVVLNKDGSVRQKIEGVVVPDFWSQNATNILATKYLRRAGVPDKTERHDTPPALAATAHAKSLPDWLRPSRPAPGAACGRETDARQAFHRLAGMWAYHAWLEGYFDAGDLLAAEQEAAAFYDEVCYLLAHQMMAPNSPQWFNTGLWWAYGIKGSDRGSYKVPGGRDGQTVTRWDAVPLRDSYQHPTSLACFINSVADNLAGADGIMDLWVREARVFTGGGGSGVNPSELRGENEPLSGGGVSSGLLSWLKIGDRAAGAIKSGGTVRRAAKLLVLDVDHPDIEAFIDWKVLEEHKVSALVAGRAVLAAHDPRVHAAVAGDPSPRTNRKLRRAVRDARAAGVPHEHIRNVVARAVNGLPPPPLPEMDCDWQGEAYQTVSGQNANNSIRCPDSFMEAVRDDKPHHLYWRTELRKAAAEGRPPVPCKTLPARELWERAGRAEWSVACPGINYATTVNDWNTCPEDGEIVAANPCQEYNYLNDTGCNLASLNLVRYYDPVQREFRIADYLHAAAVSTVCLDVTASFTGSPSAAVAAGVHNYRTLGLGYANLGALLMRQGVAYDSDEGRALAAAYTALFHCQAYRTSSFLARRLSPFPRFAANRVHTLRVIRNHAAHGVSDLKPVGLSKRHPRIDHILLPAALSEAVRATAAAMVDDAEQYGVRNAQVSVQAPTGTISFVMDCDTTGIEPDFALVKYKSLAGGGFLKIVNQSVPAALERLGYDGATAAQIVRHVGERGTVEGSALRPEHLAVFDCANRCGDGVRSIRLEGHIRMLAAIQPWLSGGASKTLNAPADVTVRDLSDAKFLAWELGVKCTAGYRDGSKLSQPLTSGADVFAGLLEEFPDEDAPPAPVVAKPKRRRLPNRRPGYTQKVRVGSHKLYLRTGEYPDGTLGEIFIDMHKEGAAFRALMNSFAVAVSLGLQHGVPLDEYIDAYVGTKFEPNGPVQGSDRIRMSSSLLDYIFRQLAVDYLGRQELANVTLQELSPPAPSDASEAPAAPPPVEGGKAEPRYSGEACGECGEFALVVTGRCKTCLACYASSGGCG